MVTRIRNDNGSLSNSLSQITRNAGQTLASQDKAALAGSQGTLSGGSGYSVGSNGTGQVAFTGDSTFNDQSNALSKAAADYAANINAQRQQATQQYDWNREDLARQSGEQQYNGVNDFAGRGMLNSGLYAKTEDDRQAGVTRQGQQMALGLQNTLSGYDQQQSSFNAENAFALNKAKADAIARQAAKIGIG